MQFLGNLGVDLWLLFAQILNFIFLLWLLSKFVYKPLIARIEADEATLAEVQIAQETLTKKEEELLVKEKKHATRLKNRAKSIISEAEEIADTIHQNARNEADDEKKAVIAQINKRLAEVSHE